MKVGDFPKLKHLHPPNSDDTFQGAEEAHKYFLKMYLYCV